MIYCTVGAQAALAWQIVGQFAYNFQANYYLPCRVSKAHIFLSSSKRLADNLNRERLNKNGPESTVSEKLWIHCIKTSFNQPYRSSYLSCWKPALKPATPRCFWGSLVFKSYAIWILFSFTDLWRLHNTKSDWIRANRWWMSIRLMCTSQLSYQCHLLFLASSNDFSSSFAISGSLNSSYKQSLS